MTWTHVMVAWAIALIPILAFMRGAHIDDPFGDA